MDIDGSRLSGLLPVGAELHGRYRIIRVIGRGGMSAVYEAEHSGLEKRVAIKEMVAAHGETADAHEAVTRFQNEARTLAKLQHRYFPSVTDFFSQDDHYYLVMEYVEGQTLDDVVRGTPDLIPEDRALRWAIQICDVLSYLHSQTPPVVFRDLKPSNIMLDPEGHVKLIDFGIARFFKPGKQSDTQMMGTAGYSAPEQYGTGQTDARSDVYALGAVMHYLITKRDPTATPFNFPPVREINPQVSPNTERVVSRCLSMRPEDRYQSAAEVKKALAMRSLESETTTLTRPMRSAQPPLTAPAPVVRTPVQPVPTPTADSEPFSWAIVGLILLIIIAASVGGYFLIAGRQPTAIAVPSVIGQDQTAAYQSLSSAGLSMSVEGYEANSAPVGQVERQDPLPGTPISSSQPVQVWLSSGPAMAEVPDVTQMSADQARKHITAAGLRPGHISLEFSDTVPKGIVIRSEPDAHFKAGPGQPVDLVVSKGPKPAPVAPAPQANPSNSEQPWFDVLVPVPADSASHAVKVIVQEPDGTQATAYDQASNQNVTVTVQAPSAQAIVAMVDDKPAQPTVSPSGGASQGQTAPSGLPPNNTDASPTQGVPSP